MQHNLYHKTGIIIQKLCFKLLDKKVGDRIKSVSDYAQEFNVANGTVQNAFKYLKKEKAIATKSRGHLGTFISKIDINKLIKISGHKDIIGVMPLPYSRLYQGFATALYLDAHDHSVDLQLAFMRGAQSRVKMLIEGNYDFIITSKLSANNYIKQYESLEILIEFGKHTYLREHAMVFLSDKKNDVEDKMRVGVDYNSTDMEILTKHQCEDKEVEYISLPYIQLLSKIKSKEIDMAVMNADDIKDRNEKLNLVEIDNDYFNYSDTEAVLLVKKKDNFTKSVLLKTIDSKRIIETQKRVLKGEIEAIY